MMTSREDRKTLREALLTWRDEGVAQPLIPVYADADGDGVEDFYGLDENDELVIVSGVTLVESVAVSTGEGVEGGGGGE